MDIPGYLYFIVCRELLEPVCGCRLIVEHGEPDNMLRVLCRCRVGGKAKLVRAMHS